MKDHLEHALGQVALTVNGRTARAACEDRTLLIDTLRDDLDLKGPRIGCEDGACGACTVEVNGATVKSCMLLTAQCNGATIVTIEGLASDSGKLDRLQEAFVAAGAQQCGYCTSGMIMSARALLKVNPNPTEQEIRDGLTGNICRCTGYLPIIRAVQMAAGQVPMPAKVEVDRWVGAALPRKEDRWLVSGGGNYTDDFVEAGMLYCAIARSTRPHARIISIDTSRAAAVPGVVGVMTGAEATSYWNVMTPAWDATGFGGKMPRVYPMAVDKVRFVGEPVAAVVAETRALAEDAAALISVTYDDLPAILSMADAVPADGLPPKALVYDAWGDNVQLAWPDTKGDLAGAFEEADLIVEDDFSSHRYNTLPMETRVVHASFNRASQQLTVRASLQIPHAARSFIAQIFNLKESNVRVIAGDVGGGFGGKLGIDTEYIPILMSVVTGRPVKWMETRSEWMTAGPQGRDFTMTARAAFRRDGTVLALSTRIRANVGVDGAERVGGLGMPLMASIYAAGGYKLRAYGMDVACIVTNQAPYGATRGYGKDIANMAMERLMDKAADELGLDRFEIRRMNLTDAYPHQMLTGPVIESGSLVQALDRLEAMMDVPSLREAQKAASTSRERLGIAIASYIEPCGGSIPNSIYQNYEAATVRLNHDGTVRVMTGIQTIGQGVLTAMAHVAADALGTHPDDVTVTTGDTDSTPYGAGAYSGRGATYGTGAVLAAADKVRARMLRAASFLLEAKEETIILAGGRATAGDKSVSLSEIAKAVYFWPGAEASLKGMDNPTLEHSAVYTCPQTSWVPDANGHAQFYTAHPGGAVGVLVAVDIDTGRVSVRKIWDVSDHGRVIHPPSMDGQIMGGTMMQLSQTLIEENALDEAGQPKFVTMREYGSPTIQLAPDAFEIAHIETLSPGTSVGAKGVGEAGCIATTTVLMAAVEDAIHSVGPIRVTHAPLNPWAVKALIERARSEA